MDNYSVKHPRPLPAGSLHHRTSYSFSDSSSSSFDHTAASPLAHKTIKRENRGPAKIVEDEQEVSFQLDKPSPTRDRTDEMKSLGLGWPSHFTNHPAHGKVACNEADERVDGIPGKGLGLGFAMAPAPHTGNRLRVVNQSDNESSKSSPPPAYGRAPMLKDESDNSLPVHTPPTQDIEHGCSHSSSQEDAVESMLDLPHSTITRRRAAVEAAATAFGLQIESSPEADRVSEVSITVGTGERDIEQQIGDLKRQLDARDKDLALTARMAQAILRRHEDLVAALPVDIKALIPDLSNISSIDVYHTSPPPATKRTSGSPRFTTHPKLPSPVRSRSPKRAPVTDTLRSKSSASWSSSTAHEQVDNVLPKGRDHRRTKSAYVSTLASSDLAYVDIVQQEADERLAKMEQALADARDSEEAQRKNAARLSRDFQKLQRDCDRLEAQAVQAAGESSSSTHGPHLLSSGGAKTPRRLRPRSSSDAHSGRPGRAGTSLSTSGLPPLRDEDEVEAACGDASHDLGFGWGPNRFPQIPAGAGPSYWKSPGPMEPSNVPLSPYTAKPERPTVLRLRRLRAAQVQTSGQVPASLTTPDKSVPSPLSRETACPPAPRLGTIDTPGADTKVERELRIASSRSNFTPPLTGSLFSPSAASDRPASPASQSGLLADEPSPPFTSTVTRGRRPRVIRTSSILAPQPAGRSWMKDYITASVRRRQQGLGLEVEEEVPSDDDRDKERKGDAANHGVCQSDAMTNGKSQVSGEEADDEGIEQRSLASVHATAVPASSPRLPRRSPESHELTLAMKLARRRQIKWADTDHSSEREKHHNRRVLPQSPSPRKVQPASDDEETVIQTPTPRRALRVKTSSNRSLRISDHRSHPYLRPLALPLAQGLHTLFSGTSPAKLRQRRPVMPSRPHSDTAVLGHRRRISSPGRELMLQIELRQREERHRRRASRPESRKVEEDEYGGGVLSIPSRMINDFLILLGLLLEWMEVTLVIVYRVFVQARNGQRPNGGQRMWARRKRYYF